MSYCTACGRPRGGPAPFCTACGAPFAGPPSGAGPGPPVGLAQGGPEPGWHADLPASCRTWRARRAAVGRPRTWGTGRRPADDFFNSLFRPDPPPAEPIRPAESRRCPERARTAWSPGHRRGDGGAGPAVGSSWPQAS